MTDGRLGFRVGQAGNFGSARGKRRNLIGGKSGVENADFVEFRARQQETAG